VPAGRRLLAFQVLAVLPTGTLLMATGGDDLPVLALMLLALTLVAGGRPGMAGISAGLAAAAKGTAWPLAIFLLVAARDRDGRRAATAFGAGAAGVLVPLLLPFLAWNPSAFVEDVVRFPLGLGRQPTPAETPTVGSLLVKLFPGARSLVVLALVVAVSALGILLLVRRPPRSASGAAGRSGAVLLAAFVLAPAARFGYVIYPIDLAVWAWMLATVDGPGRPPSPRNRSLLRSPMSRTRR
jgi:hypothetical protein